MLSICPLLAQPDRSHELVLSCGKSQLVKIKPSSGCAFAYHRPQEEQCNGKPRGAFHFGLGSAR